MNAKEQNNMEKELEKNLEETPVTGDIENSGETSTENKVVGDVAAETVIDEVQASEESNKDKANSEVKSLGIEIDDNSKEKVENKTSSNKRILQGVVVSNKSDKTIIIKVVRQVAHPLYKKYYKKSNKFMADDPNNDCNIGDIVRVKESRPLSRRKRWELIEIVNKAK